MDNIITHSDYLGTDHTDRKNHSDHRQDINKNPISYSSKNHKYIYL